MQILNVHPELKNEKMREGKTQNAKRIFFFAIQPTPSHTMANHPRKSKKTIDAEVHRSEIEKAQLQEIKLCSFKTEKPK